MRALLAITILTVATWATVARPVATSARACLKSLDIVSGALTLHR